MNQEKNVKNKKEIEIETKFMVDDISIVLEKLSKMARLVKHEYIRDTIYNLDDARLRLRIKNDFENVLVEAMFKNRISGNNGIKTEIEETIYEGKSKEEAIEKIMSLGNFIEYNSYEKIRVNYEIDEFSAHLTLDIYPYGAWVEIECSEDFIWKIADKFGFEKNLAIEKNADEAYDDWCLKNNIDMLWDVRFGFPKLNDNIYRKAEWKKINNKIFYV